MNAAYSGTAREGEIRKGLTRIEDEIAESSDKFKQNVAAFVSILIGVGLVISGGGEENKSTNLIHSGLIMILIGVIIGLHAHYDKQLNLARLKERQLNLDSFIREL